LNTSVQTGRTLIEHWDGDAWSIVNAPSPPGMESGGLSSVACESGQRCMAVGMFEQSPDTYAPFAERWNGSVWTIGYPPTPPGMTGAFLGGVSCPGAHTCTAVGDSTPSRFTARTLAERYES